MKSRSSPSTDPRPRVLEFVNSFHLGGTEGQVVHLLRGLRPDFDVRPAALRAEGPHLAELRRLGLEPYEVRLPGSLARPAALVQVARLARWLRQERVQLVHAQDFYTALVGVPAARLAGAKVVVGRLDLAHWLNPAQRVALAAACRAADQVVVNAEAIREMLRRSELFPASRISVIRNGIDLERFDRALAQPPNQPLPRLEEKTVIIHVANMVHPVKAQEDLLEAFREVVRERPRAVLLLVGDGPRRKLLEQMAAQLGIVRHVYFLGHRSDVPAILARSHLGVLCSHAEGLSNAIIEGMAASLPMVVSDAGGNRELVRDRVSGYVVPPRSPAALARKLSALAGSHPQRQRMGRAGRSFVERELALERLIRQHGELYRQVLGEPRARA